MRRSEDAWARCARIALVALGVSLASAVAHAQSEAPPLPGEALVAIIGAETPQPGTDLVLLSDVELRARMDLGPAGLHTRPTRALLAATLDEIVGEVLIAREAARLHAAEPTDAEVRAQRDRLAATLGGDAALEQLLAAVGTDPDELDQLARRRAIVDAFLRANLEGTTQVSDARVEEVFASGEHPFSGMSLDAVRESLRAWLALRALSSDVARWVEVLRHRTTVRILVVLDPSRRDDLDDDDGS